MFVYNMHDTFIGRSLALYGEWSEGEVDLLRQILRQGDVVIEGGANIGTLTVPIAQLVGIKGKVYAFEPQRLIFQKLCANLALNSVPNVHAFHAALGQAHGGTSLPLINYSSDNNFGGFGVGEYEQGERVPVFAIDNLALPVCHMVKADVEGMEKAVLDGAAETIARCRPLLYVENDREDKDRSLALTTTISEMGYTMYWHLPMLYNAENFACNAENVFENIASFNMLCIPIERPFSIPGLERVHPRTLW